MTRRRTLAHSTLSLSLLTLLAGCHGSTERAIGGQAAPPVFCCKHVVDPLAPTSGQATPAPVFATYNVHWLRDAPGLRADLSRLGFVSAWAFQEVRTTAADEAAGGPSGLCGVLPPGTWHLAWVPLNRLRELRSEDAEGQVIASRYPIRSAEVWPLEMRRGGKRRVALAATLDVDGIDVLFVNTDHEPSIFSPSHGNARQTRRLLEHLARRGDGPAVVAGDFNTAGCVPRLLSARGDRARLRRAMAAGGLEPAVAADSRTYRVGAYSAVLDHVFVREAPITDGDVDDRSRGSDHRPVWCRIDVTAAPSIWRTASPAVP